MIKPIYSWDEVSGTASCILIYDQKQFVGVAKCHPDDKDMMNANTGYEIATRRASIQAYRYHRDMLKSQLEALNQLYYSMNKSKRFNPKSYENIMLQRQINLIKTDLDTIKEMLVETQNNLKEYIKLKDDFYVAIRKNRAKKNNKANIE